MLLDLYFYDMISSLSFNSWVLDIDESDLIKIHIFEYFLFCMRIKFQE